MFVVLARVCSVLPLAMMQPTSSLSSTRTQIGRAVYVRDREQPLMQKSVVSNVAPTCCTSWLALLSFDLLEVSGSGYIADSHVVHDTYVLWVLPRIRALKPLAPRLAF